MTHAISIVLTLVAVAFIVLLSQRLVPEVRVLEVAIERPWDSGEEGPCGDAPRAILVGVEAHGFLVGEENLAPRHVATLADLRIEFHALKRNRPERTQVVIRGEDGVSFERVVAVLDAAAANELLSPSVVVEPGPPMFNEHDWARPHFRPQRLRD